MDRIHEAWYRQPLFLKAFSDGEEQHDIPLEVPVLSAHETRKSHSSLVYEDNREVTLGRWYGLKLEALKMFQLSGFTRPARESNARVLKKLKLRYRLQKALGDPKRSGRPSLRVSR